MLRREARLRKEFLYRKALEERERKLREQRERLQEALDTNKAIPNELKRSAHSLASTLAYDENSITGMTPL